VSKKLLLEPTEEVVAVSAYHPYNRKWAPHYIVYIEDSCTCTVRTELLLEHELCRDLTVTLTTAEALGKELASAVASFHVEYKEIETNDS